MSSGGCLRIETTNINFADAESYIGYIGSPIAIQIALAFRRNDLDPENPSLLATDLSIFLAVRNIELVDSPVRRGHAIQRSHSSLRFISSRQIDETIALPRSRDLEITVHRQDSFADGLQVETLKQFLQLSMDETLAGNVGQAAHEQPPAFFDGPGPMLACFFPLVPVVAGRLGCRRREIKRLPLAVLHSRPESMRFVAIALACVVSHSDQTAAECLRLEFLDHGFGIFGAGEIDETVGRVSAGEGIDGDV
jgi:hypothetical protein